MVISKRLKKYLRDLFILGIVGIISGGFFAFILFNAKDFWSIFYIPIRILTVIFSYFLINHIGQGGNVNYYFIHHEPNEDEILLNRLIAMYRNKVLVVVTAAVFILVDFYLTSIHYNPVIKFDISNVFGLFIGTFLAVGPILVGVKYFSAWWNMQKVLRKDPTGKLLVGSVINDPELIKLDNPKPLINLPKIIKTSIKNIFGK